MYIYHEMVTVYLFFHVNKFSNTQAEYAQFKKNTERFVLKVYKWLN